MSSQQPSTHPDTGTRTGTNTDTGTGTGTGTGAGPDFKDRVFELEAQACSQYGAISYQQITDLGFGPNYASRKVRSGKWYRIHKGVYLINTLAPCWATRASAALLAAGPGAALCHEAAAYVLNMRKDPPDCIDISVLDRGRSGLKTQMKTKFQIPGRSKQLVRLHHRTREYDVISWKAADHKAFAYLKDFSEITPTRPGPRRYCRAKHLFTVTLPRVVMDLAPKCRIDQVVGVVTDAVRARMDTAKFVQTLRSFNNIKYTKLLFSLVGEVKAGVESPLEYKLKQLLKLHGLPDPVMQQPLRLSGKNMRQDMVWSKYQLCVETDGKVAHPGGKTASDYWRDNQTSLQLGQKTLRFRWAHVTGMPCETVKQIVLGLRLGGWKGPVKPCSSRCQATTGPPK